MKARFYKIEALTNMHVGSGDANYGVIDNLVQRDIVSGLPTIHGSSLKGALREFFKAKGFEKLSSVFGDKDNNADYKFLSANLLAIPMRSNKKAYFLATSPSILKRLLEERNYFEDSFHIDGLEAFQPKKGIPIVFTNDTNGLLIEGFGGTANSFQKETPSDSCSLFGSCENLVILNDEDFNELCDDFNLPVIARNKVGENKNLWYEQIVPRKSIFYFSLLHNGENIADFEGLLTAKDSIIHIGANATVGYGFTKISKF